MQFMNRYCRSWNPPADIYTNYGSGSSPRSRRNLPLDPQQRKEPANIRYALKAIAEIKEVTEQTAAAIDENCRRLYGL